MSACTINKHGVFLGNETQKTFLNAQINMNNNFNEETILEDK
jgi:hypothetical protein